MEERRVNGSCGGDGEDRKESTEEDLKDKEEELEALESLNQNLIINEGMANDEVQEARKQLFINKLEPSLARRAEHYFSENKLVLKGLEVWASENMESFEKLISVFGLSSIHNYESGCEPLIQLYEILVKAPGVYGARFSGAGFRGCCIAFVDAHRALDAASFVRKEYSMLQPKLVSQIDQGNVVMICDAGDCARVI